MEKQITRNAEEQEAFEQLVHALSFMREIFKGDTFMEVAQGVERELLARGFQIVKIPTVDTAAKHCDCPAAGKWGATGIMPEGHFWFKTPGGGYLAHL